MMKSFRHNSHFIASRVKEKEEKIMNKKMFIVVFVGLILTIAVLSANVPNLIDYQGRLTDASENPLDGSYSIVFSIYDVDTGGTALWSETQTIDVNEGLFQVILGSNTSLSEDLFDGSELWIGINVESDGEMSPRTKIVSVPYSRTDRDWTIDGNDMYSNNSGNIGIGTTSPSHVVEIEGTTSNPLLYINKTGSGRGLKVRTTSACAIWVENAGNHGLRVTQANGDGVHVTNQTEMVSKCKVPEDLPEDLMEMVISVVMSVLEQQVRMIS